ncbi:CGGC domain-containing protein [Halanaerobacter jeridensis]|uniref:Metal-binding protein n=1 Tax=Halanaerobacter jeridensis TaxID=706427 RepID=A0A938XUX4_9FIRM|nr:CGGC domain-containing protein [Halanaerobacter jeridensis]MBM7557314.1 putative metal-binding protein [Halanaerobacter jeridensis]
MKVAIIRCFKKEETCIAKPCLELIKQRKNQFSELGEIELVGLITCGDCPGKKVSIRAQNLIDEGAEKIILTSCLTKGSCREDKCSYVDNIKDSLLSVIDEDKLIFETL